MKKLITTAAAVGLLAASSVAGACTLSAWSNSSGSVVVGGPELPTAPNAEPNIPVYNGVCSLQANGAGYVEDLSPSAEGTLISRIYALLNGSGSADILIAYSDEAGAAPVFTVTADGTNVTVTPTAGTAASAAMQAGWNSIEVQHTANGAINLWVNSDATTAAADGTGTDSSGATIESTRVGAPNGLGGFTSILIDEAEFRRTTNVGRVIQGNANGDGVFDINDPVSLLRQLVFIELAVGSADADENGTEDINDAVCMIQNLVFLPSCLD